MLTSISLPPALDLYLSTYASLPDAHLVEPPDAVRFVDLRYAVEQAVELPLILRLAWYLD